MNDTKNTPPQAPELARAPRIRPQSLADVAYPKTIKSFVRRAGRVTSGQTKAFDELGPRFLLPYQASALDFAAAFAEANNPDNRAPPESCPIPRTDHEQELRHCERSAAVHAPGSHGLLHIVRNDGVVHGKDITHRPTVLEIGFGMGEATAHIAAALPQTNFLCCEVHEPGVGALLKRIGEQNLRNIRICAHDAVEVIDHMLPLQSLDGVHIFFPDPWHKKKHNKRRLIQPPLIAKLAARLKVGGYLHCATDWQPYAEQMLEVLSAEPLLKNTALVQHPDLLGYAPKPHYRPLTKFENRGLKLGHGVWDLVFERA